MTFVDAAPVAAAHPADAHDAVAVEVRGVTMAFGELLVQRDLDFAVRRGEVLAVIGGSGCGKSTLLKHMIGLLRPAKGHILYSGREPFADDAPARLRHDALRLFGVMYQQGALWSSMTLAENVALPLSEFTDLGAAQIRQLARFKLALVGLAGFEDYAPSDISGGMRKRASIARAMALDPPMLYLDEPSAGLDPVSAAHLDRLILQLRDSLGTTVVVVTHELASIFAIADRALFLDAQQKTMTALGPPAELRDAGPPTVREFLNRGAQP
jgi:phospholipid/cholesterol/gamma-HCH transport system ATP-binding protein